MRRVGYLGALTGLMLLPTIAHAQESAGLGVVARLTGQAVVNRAASEQSLSLKFKDSVFDHDRITTAEKSTARLLLGGRALLTLRERSSLTVIGEAGLATAELASGKAALSVARSLMRQDDAALIRTPNAVASLRGSAVFVEFATRDGVDVSVIYVVSGPVDVSASGGRAELVSRQSVTVTGGAIGPIQPLSAEAVERLVAELRSDQPQHTDAAGEFKSEMTAREQTRAVVTAPLPMKDQFSHFYDPPALEIPQGLPLPVGPGPKTAPKSSTSGGDR